MGRRFYKDRKRNPFRKTILQKQGGRGVPPPIPNPDTAGERETMAENLFDLTGQVAIVTGASRGLGQYFSRALGRAGAKLIVTSRKAGDCDAFIAELASMNIEAKALVLDVRDEASIKAFAEAAPKQFGKVDILVNNAGMNIRKRALEVTWDDWNAILDTNLRGAFFVAQGIARHMISQGYGRIINVGSVTS